MLFNLVKKEKVISQLPTYKNQKQLQWVLNKLKSFKGIVTVNEINNLQQQLIQAEQGEKFILQVGNCAEGLRETASKQYIQRQYQLINQMAELFNHKFTSNNINKKVLSIGRIAGQFAKPRSNLTEEINGKKIRSFQGEIINQVPSTLKGRTPNPLLMLLAYFSSRQGYTELHNLDANFYTSHEGLLLDYEKSLTRVIESKNYNLSAHMLWIGARTCYIDSPHAKYFKTIENPIGIKINAKMQIEDLIKIIKTLNPNNKQGKLLLIARLGVNHITNVLPKFVQALQYHKLNAVWLVDPMHGNTKNIGNYKTRYFEDIKHEVIEFFKIMQQFRVKGVGLHLEAIGDSVTECIGGVQNPILPKNIDNKYLSLCDPRLNQEQALEIAKITLNLISNNVNI